MRLIFQTALLYLTGKHWLSDTPSGNLLLPIVFFVSDFLIVLLSHVILHYLSPKDSIVSILCIAVCIIMFFATIIVLRMVNEMELQKQRENEASILKLLLEEQKKQMLLIQSDREKLHSLRHDMKHYLLNYQLFHSFVSFYLFLLISLHAEVPYITILVKGINSEMCLL